MASVELIFRIVIAQRGLGLFETFPVGVGRIKVFHDGFPFRHRPAFCNQLAVCITRMAGTGSAIDESARVGRILQNRREHIGRWCTSDAVTKPVAPRLSQCVVPEAAQCFARRPKTQKRRKDQGYPILYLPVWIFMHYAVGVPLESCR